MNTCPLRTIIFSLLLSHLPPAYPTHLHCQLAYLAKEKAGREDEIGSTRLDPGEARARLLARVKEDNARIQVCA